MHMTDKRKLVEKAIAFVDDLFSGNSDGHDFKHTIRVYQNALKIAQNEECDLLVVELSALLHDVDDHKLFDSKENENARCFLSDNEVDPETIERICSVINSVSFSKNRGKRPDTIEGKIVQDADRLDAIGAIGIARTFSYGGKHGRSIEDSVNHFYDKLFLLKDELNTKTALEIAEERHKFMESFIEELKEELL